MADGAVNVLHYTYVGDKTVREFWRRMLPGWHTQSLLLHEKYYHLLHYGTHKRVRLTVEGNPRRRWRVRLFRDGAGGFWLTEGWVNFYEDNNLGNNELVQFTFDEETGNANVTIVVPVDEVVNYDLNTDDEMGCDIYDNQAMQLMRPVGVEFKTHVRRKDLNIPSSIVRRYLKVDYYNVTIIDPELQHWTVGAVPSNTNVKLSSGWPAIVNSKVIKEGDHVQLVYVGEKTFKIFKLNY